VKASSATAVAHPNIALVKYWGKRDERLLLPHQSSLSVTLAPLSVEARVELGTRSQSVRINGREARGEARDRVVKVLRAAGARGARVDTRGDFPAGAGLASSAAAFAAIAVAARAAAGLERNDAESSRLARLGSGSACRSVQGGFCLWRRGKRADGRDSYAVQIYPASHWPRLRLVAAIVSRTEKEISSREGMRRTVATSPYFGAWATDAEREVRFAERLVARRDLEALGDLAERNAWRMHASALGADPPICYLLPGTLEIILGVREARRRGVPVWFTLDAGPNPILLTDAAHEGAAVRLARAAGAAAVVRCRLGGDARVVDASLL
jgi:diphosphomevalonate decarboxylase